MPIFISPRFRAFVNEVMALWGFDYAILKDLIAGRSGALVLLVDISPRSSGNTISEEQSLSGQYILKVDKKNVWDPPEPDERERHLIATSLNRSFAEAHIPKLRRYHENEELTALLYEIAGGGLSNVITAESLPASALERQCSQLLKALLFQLNSNYQIERNVPARLSVENWLGYRLIEEKAPVLHSFISGETKGCSAFTITGQVLVNPLWLCNAEIILRDSSHSRFTGLLHGDLNAGNILVSRESPHSDSFWLIDFALSQKGPLLYDHAYLELTLLVKHLRGTDPERLSNIIQALDAPSRGLEDSAVLLPDSGLLSCLRAMRSASTEWQQTLERNRLDTFREQQLLARIAAALNWINKKDLPNIDRRLALFYGAWSARRYLEMCYPDEWLRVKAEADTHRWTEFSSEAEVVETQTLGDKEQWDEIWESLSRFDATVAKYVLITGRLKGTPDLASLGLLPWSAVIDLDSASDVDGLYTVIASNLARTRSLVQFGIQPFPVDFNQGTAWLMANGWPSRHEPVPSAFREWRNTYVRLIRILLEMIRKATAPELVKFIILEGAELSGDKLDRIIEAIDEEFKGASQIILLGSHAASDPSLIKDQFAVNSEVFAANVRAIYGALTEIKDPEIPSQTGTVTIPIDRLRHMEEDMEILHSEILTNQASKPLDLDAFWRGNPPTWNDLHADLDIKREFYPKLIKLLETLLDASRNQTIELHHSPGAGGTTVAYRAAWDLRTSYPTAILTRISKLTLDRLDELFHQAQKPVLLVADAAVLSPTSREDLYHGLANRNARVVILYIIRKQHPDPKRLFSLVDPLHESEASKFRDAFMEKTKDDNKRSYLELISTNPRWEKYRSPFFYGLFTYEEELSNIERYVEAHLSDIGFQGRKIIQFLALVTHYSQIYISEALFAKMLGITDLSDLNLKDAIGEGPARLVLKQDNQVKLLHPILAKEVLRQLLGGKTWDISRYQLKGLALDFIHETVRILGSDAEELHKLFGELFIRRDDWFGVGIRGQFSELINDIPTQSAQHQVLMELKDSCPHESHYWNHLGRHHIYRMQMDFSQAEEYLKTAVSLAPEDRTHHHSLGMVRRFWIAALLKDISEGEDAPSLEYVLSLIKDLADNAFAAFSETRRLALDDNHGYITHIQVILKIAENLMRISGSQDIVKIAATEGEVGEWLRENLVVAEDLLSQVEHLRAESKPSRYEIHCREDLTKLYGDFKTAIASWESMLAVPSNGQDDVRRALATAYYAQANRVWNSLTEKELRRIVSLMEENLRENATVDRDIRTWFQAYRRLPDFSYLSALEHLETWARNSNSADANYYLYILYYLLWRDGVERNEERIKVYMEKCNQLAAGRRNQSYEWLGLNPPWCPLVHHTELGEFDRKLNFYPNKELLAPVTGIIEVYKGPQAGLIRLGQSLRAFFVPGKKFWASDTFKEVHFYLGFSYGGLRAWSVEYGPAPDLPSNKSHKSSSFDNQEKLQNPVLPRPARVVLNSTISSGSESDEPLDSETEALRERVKNFILETLTMFDNRKEDLFISKLGHKLNSRFPHQVYKQLGYSSLTDFLKLMPEIEREGDGKKTIIHRIGFLAKQRKVADNPLLERVKIAIIDAIEKNKDKELFVSNVGSLLHAEFPGEAVYKRLGYDRLVDLLDLIDEITIKGAGERRTICLKPLTRTQATIKADPLRNEVRTFISNQIRITEGQGGQLFISTLGSRLNSKFTGAPIYKRLGYDNLKTFLNSFDEFVVLGEAPRLTIHLTSDELNDHAN